MKKSVKTILVAALLLVAVVSVALITTATDYPFVNLFEEGFAGYTSDETEVLTDDYYSSKKIEVKEGETLWFGPCDVAQYFQMVGFDAEGNAVTGKIRGKDLEVTDTFNNDMVIYKYTVPAGVAEMIFSAPASVSPVYVVSKTEVTTLNWEAYWDIDGTETEDYVGPSSYYNIAKGDKLYFGVITEEDALGSVVYNEKAESIGTISKEELKLVESFGGDLGIYCYTVNNADAKYVKVDYDITYQQYYYSVLNPETDSDIVEQFIVAYGIQRPLSSTVEALAGKSALFVGDSITYGARDRAKIYEYGGWAGRIGYFCDMDVLNNGVSGACITTARVESHSEQHYIYNNLVAAKDQKFDYVIMHGLFNDASITPAIELGTVKGPNSFEPNTADVTKFADALELLFYTAKTQHPEATLGYIVNFETERNVDQSTFVSQAIAACEAWGIEYLDLYHDKTFDVEFDDGLHPSSKGYDSMYTRVANWMAALGNEKADTDTVTTDAKIMSYNVFWNLNDSDTGITNRGNKIAGIIMQEAPDILLLQEVSAGTTGWVPQVTGFGDNYGYGYYGYTHQADTYVDSSAGDKDTTSGNEEMTVILWNTSKYDCVEKGHFWASTTPDVAGSLWEGVEISGEKDYPRCINWVVLKDKTTGENLMVVNYHAEPYTEAIRNLTAQLLVEKVSQITAKYDDIAVVMGGDWNMQRGQTAYTTITGNGYGDIQKEAATTTTQGSYNAWDREVAKFGFGDYWFMSDDVEAILYEVVDDYDSDSGKYLSDHSPIIAEIQY